LEFFNSEEDLPDVIAIIRGGGSADDLAVFNDEKLVRAVASSRVPIISGIGHETDETLVDLAADFAASTPSNVAQILTPEKSREIAFLRSKIARTGENILSKIEEKKAFETGKIARITAEIFRKIEEKRSEIQAKIRILENLNPEKVLRQGYAVLRGEAEIGRDLQIETSDKIILAEVKNVERK
jgi:exodeoxyribonuclease VII large subunit